MPWTETKMDKWSNVKEFLGTFYSHARGSNWVFRGQADHDWSLSTSLQRIHTDIDPRVAEEYLLYQFRGAVHHHIQLAGMPQNALEWLALMQHHGAPTRLLDFTKSPFVACFFALENDSSANKPAALWAINTEWLETQALRCISVSIGGYDKLRDYQLQDPSFLALNFDHIFINHSIPLILPVEPTRMNERLLVQQGIFLCPGAIEKTFAENLLFDNQGTQDASRHVHKIILETNVREEALYELHAMNINQASLFRGIDGFAQSLAHKLEIEHDRRQIDRIRKMLA